MLDWIASFYLAKMSMFRLVVEQPISLNLDVFLSDGAATKILLGAIFPKWTRPLTMDSVILPAPMKPILASCISTVLRGDRERDLDFLADAILFDFEYR